MTLTAEARQALLQRMGPIRTSNLLAVVELVSMVAMVGGLIVSIVALVRADLSLGLWSGAVLVAGALAKLGAVAIGRRLFIEDARRAGLSDAEALTLYDEEEEQGD